MCVCVYIHIIIFIIVCKGYCQAYYRVLVKMQFQLKTKVQGGVERVDESSA